jgi:restriction system protein
MPIPPFQSLMVPLLRHFSDGAEKPNRETVEAIAAACGISPDEQAQMLPSGHQTVLANRVAWAKAHFKRAGLIESTSVGVYRITDIGRSVLAENPQRIDLKFLDRFPGHREFRSGSKKAAALPTAPAEEDGMTPQEHMAFGYQQIKEELAQALLQKVKQCSPEFFEQLVVELLVAMGYGGSLEDAGRAVGKGGDGGVDGIIKEDRLGLDVIYIQAKRWEGVVGRPEIQKFAGALQGQRARKGVFITSSGFSKEAREYCSVIESKIVLIDGEQLAEFMMAHGIGVAEVTSYSVKRLDSDYFIEE